MNKLQVTRKGFTLVELLIVIALLGAIAMIVIAAINPIEQANRARDTRLKADSAQLISALDRYFAAQGKMPWATSTDVAPAISTPGVDAAVTGLGICDTNTDPTDDNLSTTGAGTAGCQNPGSLIRTDELKTEFGNRDFIKSGTPTANRLTILKGSGSSSSVYTCFMPLSNAERSKTDKLKNLALGSNSAPTVCTTTNWTTSPCYICIPE